MKKAGAGRTLAAGSIGNFGEIYDFAVFGFSVPILSMHFFPGADRTAALLSTFAVYAVAFLARPLGGLLFGFLADKLGRIRIMATTVWMMATATALIGLLPTYASIGIFAPILLVLCRVAQGLALGGETTGTTSYIVESAPRNRRGLWLGITLVFSHLPNAFVAVILIGLQTGAGAAAYAEWVWRIPFLVGGLIGIVGFWLRRSLDDPEEFKQAAREVRTESPLAAATRSGGLRAMMNVAMIQPIHSVASYLLLGFMYTFLVGVGKLAPTAALLSNAAAIVVLSACIPVGGILSDRLGRKRILTIGALWMACAAYPALSLAASGTLAGAMAGQILLVIGLGLYGGASFVAAPEFFPTAYRATGYAISYQITVALFGGTTPWIATWLVQHSGSPLAPAFYVTFMAVACLIAIQLFVPETNGVSLRTAVADPKGVFGGRGVRFAGRCADAWVRRARRCDRFRRRAAAACSPSAPSPTPEHVGKPPAGRTQPMPGKREWPRA